jgi:hypothetical protein
MGKRGFGDLGELLYFFILLFLGKCGGILEKLEGLIISIDFFIVVT